MKEGWPCWKVEGGNDVKKQKHDGDGALLPGIGAKVRVIFTPAAGA